MPLHKNTQYRTTSQSLQTSICKRLNKATCTIDDVVYYWMGNDEESLKHPVEPENVQQGEIDYQQAIIDEKLQWCKDDAQYLLQQSDWASLPDTNLQNKSEWNAYRDQLRELRSNPVEDPVFPEEPQVIWNT